MVWDISINVEKINSGEPNNEVKFGVLWDENYLYIGVRVKDSDLYNNSPDDTRHEADSVEIYIDAENNGGSYGDYDRQIIKRVFDDMTSIWANKGSTAEIIHAYAIVDEGYSMEFAIPWSEINITPVPDMVIGLDIGNNDDDNGGGRDSQLIWSGDNDNWRSTSAFGDCILSGETVGNDVTFIQEIKPIILDVEKHKKISFPTSVTALMSDGEEKQINIEWRDATIDTGKIGYHVYFGQVLDYEYDTDVVLVIVIRHKHQQKPVKDKNDALKNIESLLHNSLFKDEADLLKAIHDYLQRVKY